MSKQTTNPQVGMATFLAAPEANDPQTALRNVALVDLREDPENARKAYDRATLQELAASIQSMGLLEPIIVRPDLAQAGVYCIVSGHRRFRAAQLIHGMESIPCIIRADLADEDVPLAALIENLQREDLTPYEQAVAFNRVLATGALNKKELCEKAGITANTLKARLELLEFPPEVGTLVGRDGFSLAHAKLLLPLADADLCRGLGTPKDKKQPQEEADQAFHSQVLGTALKAIGSGKNAALVTDAPRLIAEALAASDLAVNVEKDRKLIQDAPQFLASIKKLRHAVIGDAMVVFERDAYKDKRLAHKAHAKAKTRTEGDGPISKQDKLKASKRREVVNAAAETQMRDAMLKAIGGPGKVADALWCLALAQQGRPITTPEVDFSLRMVGALDEKATNAFRGLCTRDADKAIGDVAFKAPPKWWLALTPVQQAGLVAGLDLANSIRLGWPAEGFLTHYTGKGVDAWRAAVDAEVQDIPEPVEVIAP